MAQMITLLYGNYTVAAQAFLRLAQARLNLISQVYRYVTKFPRFVIQGFTVVKGAHKVSSTRLNCDLANLKGARGEPDPLSGLFTPFP